MFDSYGVEASDYLDVDVVLSDYGTGPSGFQHLSISPDRPEHLATPERGDHRREIQPVALRCPEALLGCEWTTKADIWNLGCIVRACSFLIPSSLHPLSSVVSHGLILMQPVLIGLRALERHSALPPSAPRTVRRRGNDHRRPIPLRVHLLTLVHRRREQRPPNEVLPPRRRPV